MEWQTQHDQIPARPHLSGIIHPIVVKGLHQERIQDASNRNPRNIKANRNEFDTNGHKTQVNRPGRNALFVENASGNQKPRIQFHRETSAHAPTISGTVIRNENINHRSDMMLYNRGGTLDTARNTGNPEQIDKKVAGRNLKKQIKPLARPRLGESFREHEIPILVHDIQHNDWHQNDEIETIVRIAMPVFFVAMHAG